MKAWERELQIIQNAVPQYLQDDNEVFWEEQNDGPEQAQNLMTKIHYHSQVPGSRAQESICCAAIQATENKGMIVEKGMALYEEGIKAYHDEDYVKMREIEFDIYNACNNAKKDESSPYWNQKFYENFEEYAAVTNFPYKEVDIETKFDCFHGGWLAQIIGGAYGTCIEGYTGKAIKEKYNGELCKYVRKPNTYNDDITYELALLLAYEKNGKNTSSLDIARQWIARIPSGWSAEEWALNNLKSGVMPPYSGKNNNPFNEWIGAQMRGAICGQLYPGNLKEAAKCAWKDACISHDHNGIFGEVFNAMMVSMAFYENDVRKIVKTCVDLMPKDSEYGQVVRFAYEQCLKFENYNDAWLACEKKYQRYNWVHVYPNACAQIVALYYGNGDFNKTISTCGGCGQDVDCNAAQILTVIGTIGGYSNIPNYWKDPIGDELITYVRGLKKMSIKDLAKNTMNVANSLKDK